MGQCGAKCDRSADKASEAIDPPVDASPQESPFSVDIFEPPVDVSAPLDERDIALVQQTWGKAALLGVETVGVVLFTNIFEIAPEAKALFPFKDEPDLANSPALKAHGVKVVTTIATAVSLLDDLDTLVPVLQSLGLRHFGYQVLPAHYDVVGQALIKTLSTALASNMTPAVTNAYLKVYTIIKDTMVGACDYKSLSAPEEVAEQSQETPFTVDLNEPPVDVSAPLDERDIALVQQTWAKAAELGVETVGVVLFTNIFDIAPEAKALFPFKEEKDLLNSLALKAHGVKVVTTVATAVSLLGDLDTLVPVLQSLGLQHFGYKVVPAHYDVVGQALIKTLSTALGSNMTTAVTNAYLKVYTIIKNTMVGACDYTKPVEKKKLAKKPVAKSKPKVSKPVEKKEDEVAKKKAAEEEAAAPKAAEQKKTEAAEEEDERKAEKGYKTKDEAVKALKGMIKLAGVQKAYLQGLQAELKGKNARNALFAPAMQKASTAVWDLIAPIAEPFGFESKLWHEVVLHESVIEFAKEDKNVKSMIKKLVGLLPMADDKIADLDRRLS